jgi:hypothetical protein
MVKVFISYAHEDARHRDAVLTQLANLRRLGRIETWSDLGIETGAEWERAIWENFKSSQIIVLLISADFINSDFCYGREFKAAMDAYRAGRVALVPVIVRACHRKGSPIDSLQCLFADKPVSQCDPDEAWTLVASDIETKVARFETLAPSSPAHPGEPSEGDELRYLCDRQKQEMGFANRFSSTPVGVPQIYFLPGNEDAAHASFVRRVRFRSIPELLGQAGESMRDSLLPVVAPWVQDPPTGDELGYLLDRLAHAVTKRPGAKAAEIRTDPKLAGRWLVIEHSVYARNWNPAMTGLLRDYIRFWAPAENASGGPRVVVFLHIIFSAKQSLDPGAKAEKEAILGSLKNLAAEVDGKPCAVIPLSELSCIQRDHVSDWVRSYADDRECDNLLDTLFSSEECVPLKVVEKQLVNFLNTA